MSKVTVFEHINETKKPYYVSIEYALDRIRKGKSKDKVIEVRAVATKTGRDKLKMKLPCICFSGVFKERKKTEVISHSGFICLDFDKIDTEETKLLLQNDPYVFACWVSPSGDGVKALVKIPATIDKHEQYFDALKEAYPTIDPSGRDITRVCYESYDPEIYTNHTSKVWDRLSERDSFEYDVRTPVLPITNEGDIIERIMKWLGNRGEYFTAGSRNLWVLKAAGAFNRYGINEYTSVNYLTQYSDTDFTKEEIERTVKNAYKAKDQHGVSYFENITIKQDIRKHIRSGIAEGEIVGRLMQSNEIQEHDARRIVEDERKALNNKLETFWNVEFNAKGIITKLELNRRKFIDFLHTNGYFRYRIAKDYIIYICVNDNQVDEVQCSDIKNFVFNWIDRLEDIPFDGIDKHFLYEFMAKGIKNYFSKDLLDLLDIADIKVNTDTKDTAYFYYINGAVQVSKDAIELINYADLPAKVWKNQIIPRHVVITSEHSNNTYSNFLTYIVRTQDDLHSLISIIGYLLHKYKDKKTSKAPILTDQQSNDNPEGGSGKGLIIDGIRQLRRVVTIDGKNFSSQKTFAFQRIEVDTELIFVDDVPKGFKFENLFSIITEGITVEKKNKPEFFIPFEQSPKIVLSTNYYIRGEGASNDRRKVDIEITNYFNALYTPFDQFGLTLFSDWDADTWNDFDNSMMFYCQLYLKHGIHGMNNESIRTKKLESNTTADFVEFAETIPLDCEVNRAEQHSRFVDTYSTYKNKLPMRTFIKWVDSYCQFMAYEFDKNHRRSGNDFFIYIKTPDNGQERLF